MEPSGTVQSCWNAVGIEKYRIGTLCQGELKLENNYFRWQGWTPFRDECTECSILPLCMGGCPYKSLYPEEVGSIEHNSCTYWKFNLERMLKLYYDAFRLGLLETNTGLVSHKDSTDLFVRRLLWNGSASQQILWTRDARS